MAAFFECIRNDSDFVSKALKEEMKPSALFINDSQSSFGIKGAVKVDQQALEEVQCTCMYVLLN